MTHSSSANADDNAALKAWFKLVPDSNSLLVLPMCNAKNETKIHFEISATKIGPSGRSQSKQRGQKLLSSQQETTLSTLQFGIAPGDRYQFVMSIFVDNALVTTVTSEYP